MDYMVDMIGGNQLDRFTTKKSYDYLLRHLSLSQILIAKNEECNYHKAISELTFRYGEPQTVVNEAILTIESFTRRSI